MEFSIRDLLSNITYKTSRSGGKGGQNVNKVSSKVELNYDINNSELFTEDQKRLIVEKLRNRLTSTGMVQVISEEERSQYLNKEKTLQKLFFLLKNAVYVQKERRATKPKKSSIEQRLKNKQLQALKKLQRGHHGLEF